MEKTSEVMMDVSVENTSEVLKAPVWTWEVPLYFFAGGTAGAAALIAFVASVTGDAAGVAGDARWVAVAGALASPPLLISDLGRPSRFLNMLRVFKLQSPMSVGAWTLAVFTPAVIVAALFPPLAVVAGAIAAATGLVMCTYSGVLIGATVIPVWSRHRWSLPVHFAVGSLGASVSILELLGHRDPRLNSIGIAAAAIETAIVVGIELLRSDPVDAALLDGSVGLVTRAGGVAGGPAALVLRLFGAAAAPARIAAATLMIAGSLLTRFGWLAAGRRSVDNRKGHRP